MVKKGTPRYWGSSSYHPSGGRGTPVSPSESERMTRYWVSNWASMKSRCLVGATRTTSRCSDVTPLVVILVRQRMVSFENPFEAGACTSKTSGRAPSPSFVVSQRERTEATSEGSRWARSGMVREFRHPETVPGWATSVRIAGRARPPGDGCVRSGATRRRRSASLPQREGSAADLALRRADQVWGIVAHLEGPAGRLERSAVFGQAWLTTLWARCTCSR